LGRSVAERGGADVTTTCQSIVDRAKSFNTLNTPLASDPIEMLSRIRADQQALFTGVAGETRDRFQTTKALTSSSGSSERSFALAALTPPIERVLMLTLGDGREASQVDVQDVEAELVPRYIVRGQTLVEVKNDWGLAGIVSATLVYVYGATAIDINGVLTQQVSVPDEWTDLLVLPLAQYLFQKDPGRDPAEGVRIDALLRARQESFLDYLTNYGGVEVKRFVQPSPRRSSQKK
jgi:hypothetical protein